MNGLLKITPTWRFRGRQFRTITGLQNALFEDSGALTLSSIGNERITASTGDKVLATYLVSTPERGGEKQVTRESSL